jgi:hypothetical protein
MVWISYVYMFCSCERAIRLVPRLPPSKSVSLSSTWLGNRALFDSTSAYVLLYVSDSQPLSFRGILPYF